MARRAWAGPVEKYIRKVLLRGRPVYRVQMGGQGRGNRRSKVCQTLEEAVATKKAWLAGGIPVPAAGPPPDEVPATFEDGLRHYALDLRSRGKPASADNVDSVIRRIGAFGSRVLDDLTPTELFELKAERLRSVQEGTVRAELIFVRAMLRKARPEFVWPKDLLPPEHTFRVRWLRPTDEAVVFPLQQEPFATISRLAAITLMRQGEIRTLTRDMVYLEHGLVLLPRAKKGPRRVPLSTEAIALLTRALAGHQSPWVFVNPRTGRPYHDSTVGTHWRRAARQAGLRRFTFHDLRHHGATVAVNNGASDRELKALGGWATSRSVDRYASVLLPTLHRIAEGVSRGLALPAD